MAKKLQAWVRFGIRHNFDEDMLDPMNSPAFESDIGRLRAKFIEYANSPEGLEKTFRESAQQLRVIFAEKKPSLRLAYASALPAVAPEEGAEVNN